MSGFSPDIRRERIRLTAQWYNIIAAGFVVAGMITPLAANGFSWKTAASGSIFAVVGWALHRFARDSLGDLL